MANRMCFYLLLHKVAQSSLFGSAKSSHHHWWFSLALALDKVSVLDLLSLHSLKFRPDQSDSVCRSRLRRLMSQFHPFFTGCPNYYSLFPRFPLLVARLLLFAFYFTCLEDAKKIY
jgi:hypothetical protein